jgi:predicted nucleic acid-binding Zn ribbon protein
MVQRHDHCLMCGRALLYGWWEACARCSRRADLLTRRGDRKLWQQIVAYRGQQRHRRLAMSP